LCEADDGVYPFHNFLSVSLRTSRSGRGGLAVLPDQLQDPAGPLPVRAVTRPGSTAPCARAWQSGCLILVPGGGSDSALAATAGAAPHLAVAAVCKT